MWSDNYEGWFDYDSSQDYSDIDHQIHLFEMRQSIKRDKHWKQKRNQSLHPISTRKLQSHAVLLKISCKRNKDKPKIEYKSFGYQYFSPTSRTFECDEKFLTKPTEMEMETDRPKRSKSSKKSAEKDLDDFSHFRHQFYRKHHGTIKLSLQKQRDMNIVNIRLAPVNESVQIDFMKNVHQNSKTVPHLVYHGTRSKNIHSILRFGFLVPNEKHPTNENAPIIQSVNGQAFGRGIYSSRTASYSTGYTRDTCTLLVCAAVPDYNPEGKTEYSYGNILVLPRVSQIIPLFLMDFSSYHDAPGCVHHWHPSDTQIQVDRVPKRKQPLTFAKQILWRVLSHLNNRTRKIERDQRQLFY